MAEMKGVDILILVDVGTDGSPNWKPVGGQRGATLSESVDTIETTHKASGGYKQYEAGLVDWTISCDGVYIPDDDGYKALVDALRQRKKVKVRWQEAGQTAYEGLAIVTSRDLEGPHDGEATYSMELQGVGAPTPVPTP
ncbi:phage tail tube protein [Symbiobacterium thermophilum]|uniref:Phage major tail protein, TP901-1 family n=1 Tax=Symbiobacterium thermophilum TaxID=2734 RepID=A0A953LFV9_SYMTR|nr:phage major tail protein, TP901-1 family [Symbiobacterium thermophilum]MBY6278015.1 phage major tail protein, TP901-1 family [Symbiobacterium thermophilum]